MIRTKSANFQLTVSGPPGLVLAGVEGALEGGDDLGALAAGQGADDGGLAVALNG
jgi:hypothetical protein